jgi:uncharacterized protein (TIGR04141 family)
MATQRRALTVYRIRESIGGQRVENLEDVIADPASLTQHDLTGAHEFEARLFVARPNIRRPRWVDFLEPGFGDLTEIADGVTNSAVLVAKVRCDEDCFFALTFGFGRYLLRSNSFVPNYGLRVALNAFYPMDGADGPPDPDRVRRVDAKTVAANTLHTRRQADRRTAFEDFGIDVQRDLLRAITGRPVDTKTWGTRLTGAGALRLNVVLEIDGLGDLLRQIEQTSQRDDYQERFAWIDNVRTVTDRDIIAALEDELLNKLKARDIGRLQMAPPELVDWDEIDFFRVSVKRAEEHDDVDLENYLDVLEDGGKLDTLAVKQLRTAHRLEAVEVDGEVRSWPTFRCIGGELELTGETYLISGGDFFEVAPGYLEELDDYIKQIPECDKVLPDSTVKTKEGDYNELAANTSADFLLLDKKTVRVSGKTSAIEVCDILTQDGFLIHVKRKLGSSSLSHLFAQGYVSGDLFHMSQEYREAVLAKIRQAEEERAAATGDPSFVGRFSSFDPAGISPGGFEVVYAIVANWKGRAFVEALPFFSKVNLRRHARDLGRLGYRVSHKKVQADPVD